MKLFDKNYFKNYNLVIFDFDGTIAKLDIDWNGLKKELKDFCKRKYGLEKSFQPLDKTIQEIKDLIGETFIKECNKIIAKYELKNINKLVANDNILKIIKYYTPRKRKAIFSDNLCGTIKKGLKILKINKNFDMIIGRDLIEEQKPNPEGLFKIMQNFRVERKKIIFIGDSKKDKIAGHLTKIKTVIL